MGNESYYIRYRGVYRLNKFIITIKTVLTKIGKGGKVGIGIEKIVVKLIKNTDIKILSMP